MRPRPQFGITIVEAVAATAILMVVAVGTLGTYTQQLKMNADARHSAQATALAQDLVENIATWSWNETLAGGRLANTNTGNDDDIGDNASTFEGASPSYDHREADLGTSYNGLPACATGDDATNWWCRGFERYWTVAFKDNAASDTVACDASTGAGCDAVRVAVIVRWRNGDAWRRIVLVTTKLNPGEMQ